VKQRVPEQAAGERLDRYLASLPEIGSRGLAERVLADGVLVDGATRAKSHRLSGGEELEFDAPERAAPELEPEQIDLRIAYEDEHLVVVDKPAGLVVHPAPGHATGTLVHGLLAHDVAGGDEDRPGIVHRLDRDTSGLLVVARSEEAHKRLQSSFGTEGSSGTTARSSSAGPAPERAGSRRRSVGTGAIRSATRSTPTRRARRSRTSRCSSCSRGNALLAVRLETGRTHQIRVHLNAIGLPVAGDSVYGRPRELGLDRQFLHAARLAFTHPFTGARVDVESPLPEDLQIAARMAAAS
jgi:23S rRNA pseudouridine1911/1915/1917 synthase